MKENNAFWNMAIDEAILIANIEGKSPNTIRLYRWKPSAVTIGYFQSLELEVDMNAAKRLGVDVTRRITGGGAVFHDFYGEITYSVVAPIDGEIIPRGLIESYKKICSGLIEALRKFSIEATFRPYNDILVGNKKISGSAQTRRKNHILQHGTLLVDVDIDKMFTLLKVPDEKIRDKIIQNVKERVTSMRHILGYKPDFYEVAEKLEEGFRAVLNVDLKEEEPTDYEIKLAEKLVEKFKSEEWIKKR